MICVRVIVERGCVCVWGENEREGGGRRGGAG